ncbi:Acetyl-CoA hydrolase/transferase C-terminal domain-containing protein [Anaerocolumna jejuensis DSM 15929]|uniref:Acetyl-CoA hydrolase/transferase C-terminal domain-containing protein n=1 Tax=Anaerocolumna jejuensis DSM 15929 TaxID=1121322 RepID=A0A1M7AF90_9FIRM|nr:acetyl-CoA hydrolase/transferase C-terminal domain-containing protein [Anaerocolumna jejuensis]SHL41473.1 Acetyl-CoA hydrolase/transferase C-terminal domain-containing protein [Anaerocolumna jejuensis DSM 15929]
MDWKKIYDSKVKSPQEAVKIIHSGDRVLIAHAAAEPDTLVSAMVEYAAGQNLKNINIVQQHDMGACRFFEPSFLTEGTAVTTSRNDVDYIVTEYGIAHLKGKCLRERARELIKIAAPAFREELSGEFLKRFGKDF